MKISKSSFKSEIMVPVKYSNSLSKKIKIGTMLEKGQLVNTLPVKDEMEKDALPKVFNDITSDFSGEVCGISRDLIVVKTHGFEMDLFDAIGEMVVSGEIFCDESAKVFAKNFAADQLEDKILVTDTLNFDQYAKLNALGVKFVLVNHIKFETFYSILNMKLPLGVITGFGECHLNKSLYKVFEDAAKHGKICVFDPDYKRFIIPELDKGSHQASFSINLNPA